MRKHEASSWTDVGTTRGYCNNREKRHHEWVCRLRVPRWYTTPKPPPRKRLMNPETRIRQDRSVSADVAPGGGRTTLGLVLEIFASIRTKMPRSQSHFSSSRAQGKLRETGVPLRPPLRPPGPISTPEPGSSKPHHPATTITHSPSSSVSSFSSAIASIPIYNIFLSLIWFWFPFSLYLRNFFLSYFNYYYRIHVL